MSADRYGFGCLAVTHHSNQHAAMPCIATWMAIDRAAAQPSVAADTDSNDTDQ